MLIYSLVNQRDAPEPTVQPRLRPLAWRMVETGDGVRYLLVVTPQGSLRVTSPVVTVDPVQRSATTASGRVYELYEAPVEEEVDVSALRVLQLQFGLASATDISAHVWAQFTAAKQ